MRFLEKLLPGLRFQISQNTRFSRYLFYHNHPHLENKSLFSPSFFEKTQFLTKTVIREIQIFEARENIVIHTHKNTSTL